MGSETSVTLAANYITWSVFLHVLILLKVSHAISKQDLLAMRPSPKDKTRPLVPGDFQLEIEAPIEYSENEKGTLSNFKNKSDVKKQKAENDLEEIISLNQFENKPRLPRRIFGSHYTGYPIPDPTPGVLLYHGRDINHNVISPPRFNGHLHPTTAHDSVLLSSPQHIGNDFTHRKYPILGHTSHVLHPNQLTETFEGGWRPVIYPAPYNVIHHSVPKPSYALSYGNPYTFGRNIHGHDLHQRHHESYKPEFVINQQQYSGIHGKPSYFGNNPHSISSSVVHAPHTSVISPHIHDHSSKTIINGPLFRELPHQHKPVSFKNLLIKNIKNSHLVDHQTPYTPNHHLVIDKPSHESDYSSYGHIDDSNYPSYINPNTQVTISYDPIHITTHGPNYRIHSDSHYHKQPKSILLSKNYVPLDTEPFKNYLNSKYNLKTDHSHNALISPLIHSKSDFGLYTVTSSPYDYEQLRPSSLHSDYHITTTTPGYGDIPAPESDYNHPTTPTHFDHHSLISNDHGAQNYNDGEQITNNYTPEHHDSTNTPHNDDLNLPQYHDQHFSENVLSSTNTTADIYTPQYTDKNKYKSNQTNFLA